MDYEQYLKETIQGFSDQLPHFEDGRIDYSSSAIAPVVTIFVSYAGRVLLLKRSDKVASYRGRWNVVGGYLDEVVPLEKKVYEELREELGLDDQTAFDIEIGEPYVFNDLEINKTWITHPVLVILDKKPDITIDWEHTDFVWVSLDELAEYNPVSKLPESFRERLTNKIILNGN